MSNHIYSHNKTLLLYHLVFPAKYRRHIFTKQVHFLIQSILILSVTKIVTMVKSITAKELYKRHPEIRKILWGGNIWTSDYYVNTVGAYGDEAKIQKYVANQGEYEQILIQQLKFDF